jgi:hypothetical protein
MNPTELTNNTILTLAGGEKGTDPLSPGLGKMYVVQAGCVILPFFFLWLMVSRARVEEVQIAIHH